MKEVGLNPQGCIDVEGFSAPFCFFKNWFYNSNILIRERVSKGAKGFNYQFWGSFGEHGYLSVMNMPTWAVLPAGNTVDCLK